MGDVTIAVTKINGETYVSINNTASTEAINRLRHIAETRGAQVVISSLPGQAGHAERALYQTFGFINDLKIGVSSAPCLYGPDSCKAFFADFKGLFWKK